MNDKLRRTLVLLAVFCITFLAVYVIRHLQDGHRLKDILTWHKSDTRSETYTLRSSPSIDLNEVEVLAAINQESAAIVRAAMPAVVSIDTSGVRHERYRDFWGRTWVQPSTVQGQGSGVIVTEEGHVLTNHHVIQGTPNIRLTLHDGSVYSAKVIGTDPAVDIAVLKIDDKGPFQPLKFGDSSKIEVGNIVFAVGNPFGLGKSVTDGKISAKKRSFSDSQVDLLQTSAAINPGNSGGPLVNIRGEIIGINSRIYSTDKKNPGFQGIGFAIPSNAALETMKSILARGRPTRGFLGMALENLDPFTRKQLNFKQTHGVRVAGLVPQSPATQAGLRPNDIITRFNGTQVRNTRQLITLIQQSKINSDVRIEIWRDGAQRTLTATMRDASDFNQNATRKKPPHPNQHVDTQAILTALGIYVREPTHTERSQGVDGVIISKISRQSQLLGKLRIGDVIRAINSRRAQSADDFLTRLAASAAVQDTELLVKRGELSFRITLSRVRTR
ncbi:MAG: trypsin-like peptidase domain-containing protein [Verrucomicrobiae bacterium]|nr:trypsin-like peptidase domain-containing protein [Verrucomicrobiae bacterium]